MIDLATAAARDEQAGDPTVGAGPHGLLDLGERRRRWRGRRGRSGRGRGLEGDGGRRDEECGQAKHAPTFPHFAVTV